MKLSEAALMLLIIISPLPAIAEVSELKNPSWKEVPNSTSPNAAEQFNEPAFVDMNGIVQKDDSIVFDMVNSDVGYARVEVKCSTNQLRSLREGYFKSKTQIDYVNKTYPWSDASGAYQKALMNFFCSL